MTQDKDQMPAEFEARQFRDLFADAESRERKGHGYKYMGVNDDWDTWQAAWQAARASAPQPVAKEAESNPAKTLGNALNQLLSDAEKAGCIITVDALPQKPLAMGHIKMLGIVRPSRALYSAPDWQTLTEIQIKTAGTPQPVAQRCACPSGDGSLRWPCLSHPPEQRGLK